ncbi:MAG: autotransporter-associated beta strand repeat-containing protein [Planctomycetes bacterium]|nr:autotransporter-associated beta strand repeat-containing protein [Planctomycetota bacterium]
MSGSRTATTLGITGGAYTITGGTSLAASGLFTYSSTGASTISAPSALAGALTYSNGKLVLSGTNSGSSGAITVQNAGNAANGWLEFASGATWTATSVGFGGAGGNQSVMHQTGGALQTSGAFNIQPGVARGFGFMSGGSLIVGNGMTIGGNNTGGSTGGFYISGGSVTANTGTIRIGGTANNSHGAMAVNGTGSFSTSQLLNVGPSTINPTGHLTIGDSALVTASNGIVVGGSGTGGNSFIELNGGTLTTTAITKGTGVANIYFNGGKLQSLVSGSTLLASNVSPFIFAGGATIDTPNGKDTTIAAALLASNTNQGITSLAVGTAGNNYSYVNTSFDLNMNMVTFTGGVGTAATAAVTLNTNGGIASITIMNPGSYTTLPTSFALNGPQGGPGQTVTFVPGTITGSSNSLGGLTKTGVDKLTLGSGASTYTGPTRINLGTLSVSSLANGGGSSSVGASTNVAANLVLNGGTLQYTGAGHSTDRLFSVGTSNGKLEASGSGTVDFTNTGSMGFNSQIGTRTLTLGGTNTGNNFLRTLIANDGSGNATSLTKTDAGKWILTNSHSYSGATTVSNGRLALSTGGTNNIPLSPSIKLTSLTSILDVSSVGGGFTLAGGQTLSGIGSVEGAMTIGSGSTLSPGNSPGIIGHVGSETWATGGNYNWQILDATGAAGTGFDQLAITGVSSTLTIGTGFNFNLWSLSSTGPDVNGDANNFLNSLDQYWIVATTTGGLVNPGNLAFANISVGATNGTSGFSNNVAGGTFSLIQGNGVNGTVNDVVLKFTAQSAVVVPEPGTLAMAAVGLLGLALLGWRRSSRAG